jgi:ornithine decarboxylase
MSLKARGYWMVKFIFSQKKALEQHDAVKKHCTILSYSSKTNQDVTKVLEENTDCMFSVHFANELRHIKDKSRAIFLAQGWDEEMIEMLIQKGVRWFIVDNESDLDTIIGYLGKNDAEINLFLRLKLKELSIRTERYYVFGMGCETIKTRIRELRNDDKTKNKIKKLGIHFHRKTQNMSEWNIKNELESIIDKDTLKMIDFVNIGGGLPSEYANTNVSLIDGIFRRIDELRQWLKEFDVETVIEPGRFIAAPAVKLSTKIIGIHGNTIIVDASVYNGDMDAIIVPVKLIVEGELSKGEGTPYIIKGITPCSMDIFRYRVYLKEPKTGDLITFLNAGAYNFASDFCDLEKIETEIVE